MAFLYRFSREVNAVLNLEAILHKTVQLLREKFCCSSIEIFLSTAFIGNVPHHFTPGLGGTVSRQFSCSDGLFSGGRDTLRRGRSSTTMKKVPRTDLTIALPGSAGCLVLQSADAATGCGEQILGAVGELIFAALNNGLAYELVSEQAVRDGLTGLYNRRMLEERLAAETGQRKLVPLTLMFLDLDNFKQINDSFGHPAGDTVIAAMGRILRACCRSTDIVARYGGEEFAVLFPATTSKPAVMIAERVRSMLAGSSFVFAGAPRRITTSIGIACRTSQEVSARDLQSRADQALYLAKHSGKDRIAVYGKLIDTTASRSVRQRLGQPPRSVTSIAA